MANCLFIIDVQAGFLTEETRHVVDKILHDIDTKKYDYIMASRFINVQGSPFMEIMGWYEVASPDQVEINPFIYKKANKIISKNGYTALTTEAKKYITKNNITEVYIVGIDTDCCVLGTAKDLFEFNKKTYIIKELCASTGGVESHKAGIKVLERLLGKQFII